MPDGRVARLRDLPDRSRRQINSQTPGSGFARFGPPDKHLIRFFCALLYAINQEDPRLAPRPRIV
jgi:hypothetical protein